MPDKRPINEKGRPQGYWETYFTNGKPHSKVHYVNGVELGFSKYWFKDDGKLTYNEYYAK
jgi:antitoxin component YwqK of YwqJK toxin-antitoxin module